MTKYGQPVSVPPASNTFAMFGWSIIASACRSASKRATTWCVHGQLDDLERDAALHGFALFRDINDAPKPPSPSFSRSLYLPIMAPEPLPSSSGIKPLEAASMAGASMKASTSQ
jgi:hypothetical protein